MRRRAFIVLVVGSLNSPDTEASWSETNLSGSRLGRVKQRFREWRRRMRSRSELKGLSDAELLDIGLSRSEAKIETSKAFWLP